MDGGTGGTAPGPGGVGILSAINVFRDKLAGG
jgi:hypothetical protein